MPQLPARQWKVLGLLSAAEFADHYDIALLTMLLLQIQTGLGIREDEIGVIAAAIRMGALLSLVAGVLASFVMGGIGYGIIGDIVVGIVGAFVGGWLRDMFHAALGQCHAPCSIAIHI